MAGKFGEVTFLGRYVPALMCPLCFFVIILFSFIISYMIKLKCLLEIIFQQKVLERHDTILYVMVVQC